MGYIHNKNFQKFEGLQAIQELILPYLADPTDTLMLTADPITGLVSAQAIPSGGSGGEVNTASNLGGGLANWDSKSGVDLRFNTFNATDFDLTSNVISIDATLKSTWNGKISGITADNGLTASTSTNVQLGSDTSSGSPLLHTTFINVDSYSLIVSGNTLNGSLIGINANATNGYGVQGSGFVGGGFSSPDYPIEIGANKTTNTIQSVITIIRTPTGGGAAGLGSSIDFTAKNSTSSGYPLANQIISKLTNAVAASATSQFIIRGLNNAVAGDILTLNGNKSIQFNGYGSGTNSGTAAKWLAVDSSGNVIEENAPSGGGGLSDGDYGDITVSGTGTVMTIDNDVVTYAKIQNVSATSRILGRITAGSGDIEELTAANIATILGTTLDHGANLSGLADDDHTQYALLAGRSGGQTLIGGTAAGNDLTLQSTSNGTKGSIFFGTSEYDEVNNRLGINVTSPSARGHLVSTSIGTGTTIANALYLQNTTAAANNSQQYSPALILEGKGWKTAATAASQAVAYSIQTQPVQAVTNPQANLVIAASINGGAYGTLVTINDQGSMTVSGAIYATSSIGTNAQMCVSTTTNVPQSYRTTNGGSNLTPYIWVGDNATVTAGTPAIAIEGKDKTGGLLFCAANGTRQIARASINIGSLTNTAGSETGDLIFSTQTAGGAVAERFRIAAAGASTFQSSVTASSFVKSGGASTEALMANGGVQTVTSGTYTPTLSSGTNITSQTIHDATYIRVGSAVTVSGRIAINVTASGSVTFRMSLPVASTFSALGQGEGLISSQDGSDTGVVTETAASTTTVQMIFTATASGTKDYSYHYTYTII